MEKPVDALWTAVDEVDFVDPVDLVDPVDRAEGGIADGWAEARNRFSARRVHGTRIVHKVHKVHWVHWVHKKTAPTREVLI